MEDDDLAQVDELILHPKGPSRATQSPRWGRGRKQRRRVTRAETVLLLVSSKQTKVITSPPRQQETEARAAILQQILEPEAADRLGRIRLVKESRAQDVENRLIMLARSGQLRSKVTETQLKELLNAVAETKEEERIVVSRRKGGWEDEDDDLFADL
ncbi:hypothetical protein PZA11_006829 [Diplocarpon coronariae]